MVNGEFEYGAISSQDTKIQLLILKTVSTLCITKVLYGVAFEVTANPPWSSYNCKLLTHGSGSDWHFRALVEIGLT